jgi:hypothetical protein
MTQYLLKCAFIENTGTDSISGSSYGIETILSNLDRNSVSVNYQIWIKILYQRYASVMTAPDLIAICSYIANQ